MFPAKTTGSSLRNATSNKGPRYERSKNATSNHWHQDRRLAGGDGHVFGHRRGLHDLRSEPPLEASGRCPDAANRGSRRRGEDKQVTLRLEEVINWSNSFALSFYLVAWNLTNLLVLPACCFCCCRLLPMIFDKVNKQKTAK